jgi:hypothetical protein
MTVLGKPPLLGSASWGEETGTSKSGLKETNIHRTRTWLQPTTISNRRAPPTRRLDLLTLLPTRLGLRAAKPCDLSTGRRALEQGVTRSSLRSPKPSCVSFPRKGDGERKEGYCVSSLAPAGIAEKTRQGRAIPAAGWGPSLGLPKSKKAVVKEYSVVPLLCMPLGRGSSWHLFQD